MEVNAKADDPLHDLVEWRTRTNRSISGRPLEWAKGG